MGVSLGPQAWGCPWLSGTVLGTKPVIFHLFVDSSQLFSVEFHH